MRKFLAFLLMSMMTTLAWGVRVVTFLPGEDMGCQPTVVGGDCMSRDCVTICSTYGAFAASQYRFGKASVTTVTSTCGDILKIVFYCVDAYPGTGFSEPAMLIEGNDAVWEGQSSEVQVVAGNKQVRATRIDVYIDENCVSNPVIKPAAGTYYAPIEVSITSLTPGATIYYTLNGSDPTAASVLYTAPFTLSSDATVKAIAQLDGEVSEVVCAQYTIADAAPVRCFEDLIDMPDGAVVSFQEPLYALAQHGYNLYVKDKCGGYALIFGKVDQNYTAGNVIPAGVVLARSTYNSEPEWLPQGGFQPATTSVTIKPEEITADQVGHDLFAHDVLIKDATFSLEGDRDYILTDSQGNQCSVYFGSMGVSAPSNLSVTYDVRGIVGSYSRGGEVIYQLLPTNMGTGIMPIGFGSLDEIDDGTEVVMGYKATIIAQSGSYLFALDETGYGMVFGSVDHTYMMGDVVPAGFGGEKNTYSCQPELINPQGFQNPIDHVELVPEEITPALVDPSLRGHYVVLRGVKIVNDRIVPADGVGDGCSYFNRFNIVIPGDDNPDELYDVYGIVVVYCRNGADLIYQILPIKIVSIKEPEIVCCLEDLFAMPEKVTVQFDCPLIVVLQSGNRLYVKDQCDQYALIYGRQELQFESGDSIVGSAYWVRYGSISELVPVGDWQRVGHGPQPSPVVVGPIEEVAPYLLDWYLRFDGVTVTFNNDAQNGKNYTMSDETGKLTLYNQFGIIIPTYEDVLWPDVDVDNSVNISDLNVIIEYIITGKGLSFPEPTIEDTWHNCRVEGILGIYNNELQLYPTLVSTRLLPPAKRYDVNGDGVINISDVNEIINYILMQ